MSLLRIKKPKPQKLLYMRATVTIIPDEYIIVFKEEISDDTGELYWMSRMF